MRITGPVHGKLSDLVEERQKSVHTILLVVFKKFPSVLATEDDVVVELIPECQRCEPRPWNMCNRGQIQSPYGTVTGPCCKADNKENNS